MDAIWAVWDAFHSVAEGFGIGEEEACEILTCLQPALALTRGRLARLSRGLFRRLDTDDNGLIDSMELLSCLASISSMGLAQRIDCEPSTAAAWPRACGPRGLAVHPPLQPCALKYTLSHPAVVARVFDFDETGSLGYDETLLAARTLAHGMCKLTLARPPPDAPVETTTAAVRHGLRRAACASPGPR